ncbi:MAG: lyase family protein [Candidatus Nomurabacteria bacterium]
MKIYYGDETKKALKNFPFSNHKTNIDFIMSIVLLKKVAAIANYKSGNLNLNIKDAIVKSCNIILLGGYENQFLISYLQGGAGTASNMNVNEVIANMASEILKGKIKVHPNDHVNMSQSTNDINPSALKISTYNLLKELNIKLLSLVSSLNIKSKEFKNIKKLGRTHLQDAVPTTMGAEFLAYSENLKRHIPLIKLSENLSKVLNLGGTAIGNSINANNIYIKEVYKELNNETKTKFLKADNLMSKTSSQVDFLIISQTITSLCVDLSKIANDLRFMSSGPNGAIGEIILPELQKGSSIMPGKVNPVIPETVNQLYYLVSGNNVSIEKAVESSQMELGVMLPIIVDKLIDSIKITGEVINQFDFLCIRGIKVNKEKCIYHLECSTAYATLLVPRLGYDLVSSLVKKSLINNKTLREMVVSEKYLSEEEFNNIINYKHLLG